MRAQQSSRLKRAALMVPSSLAVLGLGLAACTTEADSSAAVTSVVEGDAPEPTASTATLSDYLGSYTINDGEFGTSVQVTVEDGVRSIVSNSVPNHETGDFPNSGNPNTISAQELTYEYPTTPTFVGDARFAQTAGVAVNGVPFEPGTAETVSCDSGEQYRIEALQDVYDLGFDINNAHVQPTGKYHYHGISELLVEAYASDEDLVHVGFAADGFLMYYSKSNAYSSSYELGAEARRGTGCVASGRGRPGVAIEGTEPDGTYTTDWEYVEGLGNLDSCNGATIAGTYAYVITDVYPFVSRCLNGEVSDRQQGGGGQGAGGQGGGGQGGGRQGAGGQGSGS